MKQAVGIAMLAIMLVLIGGIGELSTIGTGGEKSQDVKSNIGILIQKPTFEESNNNVIQYAWDNVKWGAESAWAFVSMATFENPMFQGSWALVYLVIFIPLTIGATIWIISWLRGSPS